MVQVSLDTSFLISFADPGRPNHKVAVEYFQHCVAERIPMCLSVAAAGEFEVRQSITDLPLGNFRVRPYDLSHACRAARLFRDLRMFRSGKQEGARPVILNDLKIIAQAEEDRVTAILTEDVNTLSKLCRRLKQAGECSVCRAATFTRFFSRTTCQSRSAQHVFPKRLKPRNKPLPPQPVRVSAPVRKPAQQIGKGPARIHSRVSTARL